MGDSPATKDLFDTEFGGIEGDEISLLAGKTFLKQRFGHLVDLADIQGRYQHGRLIDESVLTVGHLALQVEVREAVVTLSGSTPSTPVASATSILVRAAATGP